MTGVGEVSKFVDHDVLKALWGLLGQLGVEPNGSTGRVAASPARLHLSDEEPRTCDTQLLLPLGNEWRSVLTELAAVPGRHHRGPHLCGRARTNSENEV